MGMSYKYYTVFLTQVGVSDPTVKDLDNTLGRAIWKRVGVGIYTLTKEGAFKLDKTIPKKDSYMDVDGNYMTLEHTDLNTMTLKTYAAVDIETLSDDVLTDQYLNIEVYI